MMRQACPEPAAGYFLRFGLGQPLVDQTFHPDRGWRPVLFRIHWNTVELHRFRRQGYTIIRLSAGSHHADFALNEF